MQRIGQAQVQVGIAKAGVELHRECMAIGQFQGLVQKEVDQHLVGQPVGRPSQAGRTGQEARPTGGKVLLSHVSGRLLNRQPTAIGRDALERDHSRRWWVEGRSKCLHEFRELPAAGQQLLGQRLQTEDAPAGNKAVVPVDGLNLVGKEAVVQQQTLKTGRVQTVRRQRFQAHLGPASADGLFVRLTTKQFRQVAQAAAETERTRSMVADEVGGLSLGEGRGQRQAGRGLGFEDVVGVLIDGRQLRQVHQ